MAMTNGWNVKTIVAPNTIEYADGIKSWLEGLQISASQAIVVRNDWSKRASNGTLIAATIVNGVVGAYIRIFSSQYRGGDTWTSAYALAVNNGDSYTIFYK